MDKYEILKLENQLCFPIYVCSKEIVKRYGVVLEAVDLTYTQYITMTVLWEHEEINVKELGKYLYLDSGTLTPVLKKLEQKGFIVRKRDSKDERVLNVTLTEAGKQLREQLVDVIVENGNDGPLNEEELNEFQRLVKKILGSFQ